MYLEEEDTNNLMSQAFFATSTKKRGEDKEVGIGEERRGEGKEKREIPLPVMDQHVSPLDELRLLSIQLLIQQLELLQLIHLSR